MFFYLRSRALQSVLQCSRRVGLRTLFFSWGRAGFRNRNRRLFRWPDPSGDSNRLLNWSRAKVRALCVHPSQNRFVRCGRLVSAAALQRKFSSLETSLFCTCRLLLFRHIGQRDVLLVWPRPQSLGDHWRSRHRTHSIHPSLHVASSDVRAPTCEIHISSGQRQSSRRSWCSKYQANRLFFYPRRWRHCRYK